MIKQETCQRRVELPQTVEFCNFSLCERSKGKEEGDQRGNEALTDTEGKLA